MTPNLLPGTPLTGGDWENRANEYWRNWHRSASIAGDEQMRREQAEAEIERLKDALAAALEDPDA